MRLAAIAFAFLLLAAGAAADAPKPARISTIVDRNGDNLLELGPHEGYTTRTELGPQSSAPERPTLITFAQMTDTQLVDEESPARVEFVDKVGPPFEAAYRPQEGLLPFVLSEEVRAVRAFQPELVIVTGDNADNSQQNEVRWFIDILDGKPLIRPGSGGTQYQGARGQRRYYDPDGAGDGPGYASSVATNRRRAGRSVASRNFPGLFTQMNTGFRPSGLGRIPWYSVVGNHDALVQGNVPPNAFFSTTATGRVKVADLSRRAWALIRPLAAGGITDAEQGEIVRIIYGDVLATLSNPGKVRSLWKGVDRDARRRLLVRKGDLIREHFTTTGRPQGHGFTEANIASGEGNYTFSPKPGLRFIALDSVADTGPEGNLDDAQFRWLHAELLAAEVRRELVLVFAHHSLASMTARAQGAHKGLTGSCPSALPVTPAAPDESVLCLLQRHPSVVAFITGHSHRNRIIPYGQRGNGFWEIVTSSHTDWPQQSRLLYLVDNRDGTLSLYTRMVEHAAPPRPPARRRTETQARKVTRLASIARELAFNDPQGLNGEDGTNDRRGTRLDRNVELVLPSPY